ncbi:hypothetical protein Pelo_10065 [Pelomyxa schiedti]|nr:hypothetical protein Pelo_10065 [Pelomyxa schiedti]
MGDCSAVDGRQLMRVIALHEQRVAVYVEMSRSLDALLESRDVGRYKRDVAEITDKFATISHEIRSIESGFRPSDPAAASSTSTATSASAAAAPPQQQQQQQASAAAADETRPPESLDTRLDIARAIRAMQLLERSKLHYTADHHLWRSKLALGEIDEATDAGAEARRRRDTSAAEAGAATERVAGIVEMLREAAYNALDSDE